MAFQFKEHNKSAFDKVGYCGIGIYNPKYYCNVGVLWRTAAIWGVDFIFTVGEGRYKAEKADTTKAHHNIPLFSFDTIQDLRNTLYQNCDIVGVELVNKAQMLHEFKHPDRAVYLLGSEDTGIPQHVLRECNRMIKLPGKVSLNVAVTGTTVLYDRIIKRNEWKEPPNVEE